MPKKTAPERLPTLVTERLAQWGNCIKTLRLTQKLRIQDLCARMQITHTTLRRLEKGDPGAGAGLYLHAMMVLGALELAAPLLPAALIQVERTQSRVRLAKKTEVPDDDF